MQFKPTYAYALVHATPNAYTMMTSTCLQTHKHVRRGTQRKPRRMSALP